MVVECKSPTITDLMDEAIEQLKRYSNRRGEKEGNERLFWYNLFMVAADKEHFVEWKGSYPYALSYIDPQESITSQELLIQEMLSKENLLDILHTFMLFKEETGKGFIKIVPRFQQLKAVKEDS